MGSPPNSPTRTSRFPNMPETEERRTKAWYEGNLAEGSAAAILELARARGLGACMEHALCGRGTVVVRIIETRAWGTVFILTAYLWIVYVEVVAVDAAVLRFPVPGQP